MFSQRDPKWKNDIYDQAKSWAPKTPSFERWGCAVTAASSVLSTYNINTLPNQQPNNPGNLNTWLKTQDDGFLRYGALNWQAISRLSKRMSQQNPVLPSLEYTYQPVNDPLLNTQLATSHPVILEEPGHFITAYQQTDNGVAIVDPFYTGIRTTLASYNNTYLSMRQFTPSHTNLGYILVSMDPNIQPTLQVLQGRNWVSVSGTITYIQNPLVDPISSSSANAKPFRVLSFAKPNSGTYRLQLQRSSPGNGEFETYLYDTNGNVHLEKTNERFGSQPLSMIITYTGKSFRLENEHQKPHFPDFFEKLFDHFFHDWWR